jgi:hypothetical protein
MPQQKLSKEMAKARFDRLTAACRGLPGYKVYSVLNRHTPGHNWSGDWSKTDCLQTFTQSHRPTSDKTFNTIIEELQRETKRHKQYQKEKKDTAERLTNEGQKNLSIACRGKTATGLVREGEYLDDKIIELEREVRTLRKQHQDIESMQRFMMLGEIDVDFPHSGRFNKVIRDNKKKL